MTEAPGPNVSITPERFPIQLVDVYLYEAEVRRGAKGSDDPEGPTLDTHIGALSPMEPASDFSVRLSADILCPFRGGEAIAKVHTAILGIFHDTQELSDEARIHFAETQAIMILWPYLRAYTAELTKMTAIDIPILPTLDVLDTLNALDSAEATPSAVVPRETKRKRKPARGRI